VQLRCRSAPGGKQRLEEFLDRLVGKERGRVVAADADVLAGHVKVMQRLLQPFDGDCAIHQGQYIASMAKSSPASGPGEL